MNLQNILHEIESVDPEFGERVSPRRAAIRTFLRGVSMAAVPVALGGLMKKAYGKTNDSIIDVLNYALTLEYLESEFYKKAVNNFAGSGIPAGAPQAAISIISKHENSHVSFLRTAITGAGGNPVTFTAASFDFSGAKGAGNGPFAAAFNGTTASYATFLAVAQTFEDTGVRAYKGRAAELMSNNDVLTAALQIHSVEARHAAHIRSMRRANNDATVVGTPKPWITDANSNITTGNSTVDALIQKSYAGEDNRTQGGVVITSLANSASAQSVSSTAASESFDEDLSKAAVLDIINPFLV